MLLAERGRQYEVVYYPRVSTPEFCVRASSVREAMRVQWYPEMRFKMPFETEDSSRISWFMGSVASVQVADPVCWPNSHWRLLQVMWDEPDLQQNVKRASPWLVELVSTMPTINVLSFSSPRRVPEHPDFFDGQFVMTSFSENPLGSRHFCWHTGSHACSIWNPLVGSPPQQQTAVWSLPKLLSTDRSRYQNHQGLSCKPPG